MNYKNLGEIFKNKMPDGIGKWARGDKEMWKDLEKAFSEIKCPCTIEEFDVNFNLYYEAKTKKRLKPNDITYVEEFGNGGISGGEIASNYWIDIVIPYVHSILKEHTN